MSAIPLYLIHAYPLDANLFAGLNLPSDIDVRLPDLRGFGGRPLADADGNVPTPDLGVYAADIAREMDARGDAAAIIGGVSIGGYVALEFAAIQPGRVLGLVLANSRSTTDRPGERETRLEFAANADRGEIPGTSDLIRPLVAPTAAAEVRKTLGEIASRAQPATLAWAQRAMAQRRDRTGALSTLRVPTLVIAGEMDAVTPVTDSEALASAAARSTLVEIPDAGHLTPAEAPAEFTEAIRDWIGRFEPEFRGALGEA